MNKNDRTMLWKFPSMRRAHIWELVHVEGDVAFFSSDHRLATAAVDTAIGTVTLTINDPDGSKARVFDAKEPLCQLVETLMQSYPRPGASGHGGV